jgi:hypothetical protein
MSPLPVRLLRQPPLLARRAACFCASVLNAFLASLAVTEEVAVPASPEPQQLPVSVIKSPAIGAAPEAGELAAALPAAPAAQPLTAAVANTDKPAPAAAKEEGCLRNSSCTCAECVPPVDLAEAPIALARTASNAELPTEQPEG